MLLNRLLHTYTKPTGCLGKHTDRRYTNKTGSAKETRNEEKRNGNNNVRYYVQYRLLADRVHDDIPHWVAIMLEPLVNSRVSRWFWCGLLAGCTTRPRADAASATSRDGDTDQSRGTSHQRAKVAGCHLWDGASMELSQRRQRRTWPTALRQHQAKPGLHGAQRRVQQLREEGTRAVWGNTKWRRVSGAWMISFDGRRLHKQHCYVLEAVEQVTVHCSVCEAFLLWQTRTAYDLFCSA